LVSLDSYAQDRQQDTDFDLTMLTEKELSTGLDTGCCVTRGNFISKTRAAYSGNLQVITTIDQNNWSFGVNYYIQLEGTAKYSLKNIFRCSIKEQ
jgi:hypothetical protein